MAKLLLIDGNAIVHRAYHALPPLTAPDGTVINAMYGFFSMFFTVISDLQPEYVIVSFDISAPTYRQAMYAGYHAHRPKMEDDLAVQFEMLREALEKMNISIFAVEGFEADDVIGTLASQVQLSVASDQSSATGQPVDQLNSQNRIDRKLVNKIQKTENRKPITEHIETIILTGDRDLLQLVNTNTKVLMPVVGVKETVLYDEKKVEEKYGVKPSQFVDYKALIGDPSDGYPGVTGIGPKTAASLLKDFGTFEALYERIGELPPKVAEKLATDAEQAALAKKLATILRDVPITCELETCKTSELNIKGALEVFEQYGFNSLLKRFNPLFKEIEEKKKGQQLGLMDI